MRTINIEKIQNDVIHHLRNIKGAGDEDGYIIDEVDELLVRDAVKIAVNLIESGNYER